jgi:hypothetical protein
MEINQLANPEILEVEKAGRSQCRARTKPRRSAKGQNWKDDRKKKGGIPAPKIIMLLNRFPLFNE